MGAHVIKIGRIFDASLSEADVREAIDNINRGVAQRAFATWNILLDSRIRVNQYRYMSGNRVEPRDDGWVVHDDIDKPYGPWLEGVGSRNGPDGFPGYHSLRDAANQTESEAEDIAEEHVEQLVRELSGP